MKIKTKAILIGLINGGLLSIAPLFIDGIYIWTGGADMGWRVFWGSIFIILVLNIIILRMVYRHRARTSPKAHVFLHIFLAWIIAAAVLLVIWFSYLSRQVGSGVGLEYLVALFCVIVNFATIVLATVIAKLAIKFT